MKLHANAPFGPKGRLIMVRRVLEQDWSLTEAAEAAWSQRLHVPQVAGSLPRDRPGGGCGSVFGAQAGRESH